MLQERNFKINVMAEFEFDTKADEIRDEVTKLMDKYPIYK